MHAVVPEDIAEIWQRVELGAKEHAAWFVEYVKEYAQSGEPLPYHENFGVSRPEYERALNTKPQVVKKGVGCLHIRREEDGVLVLAGEDDLADLDGIRIDTHRRLLVTPLGELADPDIKHAGEFRSLGLWDGYRWSLEDMEGDPLSGGSGSSIEFSLGRIRRTGDAFIYYHARAISAGELTANLRVFTCYSTELDSLDRSGGDR